MTFNLALRPAADLRHTLQLIRTLAVAEFKLKYLDATLSYFWGVARPLALFGVMDFVFTHVGSFSSGVHHYALYLLTSIVLWTYFAESTATAVDSLVRNGDIIRKVPLARAAIPLSVTLTSLIDLAMNMCALFIFLFAFGIDPRLSWLELPVLILLLTLLVAGTSLLLSILFVRFRDIDQVWVLVRQALFYATPIFYVVSSLPGGVRHIASASPLAAIFTQARHALVDSHAPTAAATLGGTVWLLIPLGVIAVMFVAGIALFRRGSGQVAEIL